MNEKTDIPQKQAPKGCVNLVLAAFCLLIIGAVISFFYDTPEEIAANRIEELQKKREDTLATCYVQAKMYLKQNLKDPDSYEEIEYKNFYVDRKDSKDPYVQVQIRYRAKNSFGGMNVGNMLFNFDKEATLTDMIDLDK